MQKRMNRPDNTRDETKFLSTVQVAKAVGVSVTTIKRWVDDGVLPAHKTAGGHRKLVLADVLRLTRESGLPASDLGQLVPAPPRGAPAIPAAFRDQLNAAVEAIDDTRIRAVIRSAYRSGIAVEILADQIVSPVMAHVGRQWQHDAIDVGTEHLVTGAVVAGLFELQGTIAANASAERPVALGGAPEGDHYILPTLLAKLTLLDAGWDAINLGPNTPAESFRKLMAVRRPALIWLSVSHLAEADCFEREFVPLLREARDHGIPAAIGGRALPDDLRARLPYTTHGDGLAHLAAFARTLHTPARRPKRGRPPVERP
jgi:excisionase family DNA binding protein